MSLVLYSPMFSPEMPPEAAPWTVRLAGKDADVTRELKLALIVGFSLVLVVAVLISDHFAALRADSARELANTSGDTPGLTIVGDGIGSDPYGMNIKLPPSEPKKAPKEPAPFELKQDSAGKNGFKTDPKAGLNPPIPNPAPAAIPDATYAVVSGDTFARISRKFYSTDTLAQKLADYNKTAATALKIDQKILIPTREVLEGKAPKPQAEAPADGPKADSPFNTDRVTTMSATTTYTIAERDTLSGIAKKQLGSYARVSDIYKLNPGLEGNESSLKIGQVIKLPQR